MDNYENSSQSDTSEIFLDDFPDLTNYYFPLGFVAVLIVVVNTFIVILVGTNPKLRTNCNALLVSLAIADGTTGLLGIPLLVVTVLVEPDLSVVCYLALAVHTWFWFMSVCSIFHLLVIACEQYFAILKPFSHDKIVTKASVTFTLAIIWTVSVGHALIPWTWLLPTGNDFCVVVDEDVERRDKIFTIISIVLFFLLPVGIIIYVYFRIVMEAKRQLRRIKRECFVSQADRRESSPWTRFRGFYVIALMALFFVVCWSPYFVSVLLVTIMKKSLPFWLEYKFTIFRFLPSVFNPIMFAFWKRDFRAACAELLHCCGKKSTDQLVSTSFGKQQFTLLNRLSDSKRQSV